MQNEEYYDSDKRFNKGRVAGIRRNGIGGSDASVVMGKNPWRSIQQLWEDKTGKTPVLENSNEYTYWGNVMEGIIRKEFMNRTG